jgi:branched-chain amino acid transport system permease protein
MQILASALAQGLAIAALAFAFALVYWSTRVFFVLLGALYALAPFLVAELQGRVGMGVAVALTLTTGMGLSLLLGWANHERLISKNAPDGVHFACSLALYFLVSEVASLRWGSDVRSLANLLPFPTFAGVGVLRLPTSQLVMIGGCLGWIVAVLARLRSSGHGVKLRALADNPGELSRSGFDPRFLRGLAFGGSGLVAAGASVAVAVDLAAGVHGGLVALIPAATATLLTPVGRWHRLLACAMALGLLRTAVTYWVSGAWQEPVTLGLLLLGLLARQQGRLRWGRELVPGGAR